MKKQNKKKTNKQTNKHTNIHPVNNSKILEKILEYKYLSWILVVSSCVYAAGQLWPGVCVLSSYRAVVSNQWSCTCSQMWLLTKYWSYSFEQCLAVDCRLCRVYQKCMKWKLLHHICRIESVDNFAFWLKHCLVQVVCMYVAGFVCR